MKKGDMITLHINKTVFPGRGQGEVKGQDLEAQGAYPGEVVEGIFTRRKKGVGLLKRVRVVEEADYNQTPVCEHFRKCGGCLSLHVPLDKQREFKEREVLDLFRKRNISYEVYKGMDGIDRAYHYRNKMEFTFGDPYKDGPLHLGLHERGMGKNIIETSDCHLISNDMNKVRDAVADYYREKGYSYYHIMKREGYLRNLIMRQSYTNGDILLAMVTTSEIEEDFTPLIEAIKGLKLEGELKSFWHIVNDTPSDAVYATDMHHIYGDETITEEMLGLTFHISPLSFFQTNTEAARLLYSKVLDLVEPSDSYLDLYSGTGTLTQMVSKKAKKVTGVEILSDAVEDAKKSAKENGITNADFICSDVKDTLEHLDFDVSGIIVDPPRSGIHPKVVQALKDSGVETIIYVSCNPKTMAMELKELQENYIIKSLELIDMYPNTAHVECIALLQRDIM